MKWTLIFFLIALISAGLGFSGLAFAGAEIAKVLFYCFLVVAVISGVVGALRGA